MISLKIGGIIVAAFIVGAFVASPELRAYAAATVTSADIVDGTIQSIDIGTGQVKNSDIGSSAVTGSKISTGAITGSKVASGIALTGPVSIDGSTFKVDSTNDRVGIGTTTPQAKLDVNGNLFIGSIPTPYGAGANSLFLTNNLGDPKNSIRLTGFQNSLYVVAHSDPGASTGSAIIFRTALAGAGESDSVIINPDGSLNALRGLAVHGTTNLYNDLIAHKPTTMTNRLYLVTSDLSGQSIILRSPDRACHEIHVNNAGALSTSPITCPSL